MSKNVKSMLFGYLMLLEQQLDYDLDEYKHLKQKIKNVYNKITELSKKIYILKDELSKPA